MTAMLHIKRNNTLHLILTTLWKPLSIFLQCFFCYLPPFKKEQRSALFWRLAR